MGDRLSHANDAVAGFWVHDPLRGRILSIRRNLHRNWLRGDGRNRPHSGIVVLGCHAAPTACPTGKKPDDPVCGQIADSNQQPPDTLQGRDWQIQGGNFQIGYSMAVTYSNEFAMTFTSACKTGRSPVGGKPALSPCDDAWAQLAFYFSSGAIAFTHGPAVGFTPDTSALLATPEPASFLLIGSGLLALIAYGWTRKKKLAPTRGRSLSWAPSMSVGAA
jgi:hypothetical protein